MLLSDTKKKKNYLKAGRAGLKFPVIDNMCSDMTFYKFLQLKLNSAPRFHFQSRQRTQGPAQWPSG